MDMTEINRLQAQVERLIAENEALKKENFKLAAGQCLFSDGSGLTGDEGGTPFCVKAKQVETLKQMVLATGVHPDLVEAILKGEEPAPQKFACHIDVDYEHVFPDQCVLDMGKPEDCHYARAYGNAARKYCGEWKPISLRE